MSNELSIGCKAEIERRIEVAKKMMEQKNVLSEALENVKRGSQTPLDDCPDDVKLFAIGEMTKELRAIQRKERLNFIFLASSFKNYEKSRLREMTVGYFE